MELVGLSLKAEQEFQMFIIFYIFARICCYLRGVLNSFQPSCMKGATETFW